MFICKQQLNKLAEHMINIGVYQYSTILKSNYLLHFDAVNHYCLTACGDSRCGWNKLL